jgi:uncharacterized coiled-coil protein SlyX
MEDETMRTGMVGEPTPRLKRPFFPLPIPKVAQLKFDRRAKIAVSVAIGVAVLAVLLYQYRGVFIAATVDGVPVTRLAVIEELESRSGKEALDTLITKTLIGNAAAAANVTVGQDEVDAELVKIEEQVAAQEMTLDEALAAQGLSRESLVSQIILRKQLEKILADRIAVTDDEVTEYLKKDTRPPQSVMSSEDQAKQVRERLSAQKFSTEADKWVTEAKEKAQITTFVEY